MVSWLLMIGLAHAADASGTKFGLVASAVILLTLVLNLGLAWEATSLRERLREREATNKRLARRNKKLYDTLQRSRAETLNWKRQAIQYHNCALGLEPVQSEGTEERLN